MAELLKTNGVVNSLSISKHVACPFEESIKDGYKHSVHAMIWSPLSKLVLDTYDPKAAILMHMRFDGTLGFPGGEVDEDLNGLPVEKAKERVIEALLRELEEEINLDTSHINVSWDDYQLTYAPINPIEKSFFHFFSLTISFTEFEKLELAAMKSKEFGIEVMGNFRVPLYTMNDGHRGFPAFLKNNFIGSAKEQLLNTCVALGILTEEYVKNSTVGTFESS